MSDIASKLQTIANNTVAIAAKMEELKNGVKRAIVFTTDKSEVNIGLKGSGTVKLYRDNRLVETVSLTEDLTTVTLDNSEGTIRSYSLDDVDGLYELDLHSNDITSFEVNETVGLNKLVIYDNQLSSLDCSKCKELQFLHMFNNPVCDDEITITDTINGLPDRKGKAVGSVVFYPWHGLEILVEKDGDAYYKYPHLPKETGNLHHPDNPNTNNWRNYDFKNDVLYGVVERDSNGKEQLPYYCTRQNGTWLTPVETDNTADYRNVNYYHQIRREILEPISLDKNWLFGSAIQYSDDYDDCYYSFRDSGVQDMWETAEKGFGMCIGSIDAYTWTYPYLLDMNIRGLYDSKGNAGVSGFIDLQPERRHGDATSSLLVGRGDKFIYGMCPNAQVCFVNDTHSKDTAIEKITTAEVKTAVTLICDKSNTYSGSWGSGWTTDDNNLQDVRKIIGRFGRDNVVTMAAENDGDGLPWTSESRLTYGLTHGNYGTDEDSTSYENLSNTFFIGNLNPNRRLAPSSNTGASAADKPYLTCIPEKDYMAHYGEVIQTYHTITGQRLPANGTSFSGPNCSGVLALMRIIYTKINPSCSRFGKGSEFMEYVKTHWMDPLEDSMSFAVGMGMPYILAEPAKPKTECNFQTISREGKPGFVYDHDYKYFAELDSETLVPIRVPTESARLIPAYSKMSATFDASSDILDKNYIFDTVRFPDITHLDEVDAVAGAVHTIISNENIPSQFSNSASHIVVDGRDVSNSETFTVQLRTQFDTSHYATGTNYLASTKIDDTYSTVLRVRGVTAKSDDILDFEYVTANPDGTTKVTPAEICVTTLPTAEGYSGPPFGHANGTRQTRLRLSDPDIGVITVTYKDGKMAGYYNGNEIFYLDLERESTTIHDFSVNPKTLLNGNTSDVLIYDRVLTKEEIINNTIYLLQST